MPKSNIKEAALKAGFVVDYVNHDTLLYSGVEASLTKFAALVRAEALEQAAKLCECDDDNKDYYIYAQECADAIRGLK